MLDYLVLGITCDIVINNIFFSLKHSQRENYVRVKINGNQGPSAPEIDTVMAPSIPLKLAL